MQFAAELMTEAAEQRMFGENFGAELVVALGPEFHERKILRGETVHHLNAVTDGRAGSVGWVVQIEARREGMVWRCGDAVDDMQVAEFVLRMHVGEYFDALLATIDFRHVAFVFERGQLQQGVLGGEQAAQVGATFVGLDAGGHEN